MILYEMPSSGSAPPPSKDVCLAETWRFGQCAFWCTVPRHLSKNNISLSIPIYHPISYHPILYHPTSIIYLNARIQGRPVQDTEWQTLLLCTRLSCNVTVDPGQSEDFCNDSTIGSSPTAIAGLGNPHGSTNGCSVGGTFQKKHRADMRTQLRQRNQHEVSQEF